jgi:hypothetical protein
VPKSLKGQFTVRIDYACEPFEAKIQSATLTLK